MKFRSPNETPIRVALTSGHAAVIGHEWRELPEIFHRDALAQGAQCDATHIDNPEPPSINGGEQANGGQPSEDDAYREAILLMIERDEEGDPRQDRLAFAHAPSGHGGCRNLSHGRSRRDGHCCDTAG